MGGCLADARAEARGVEVEPGVADGKAAGRLIASWRAEARVSQSQLARLLPNRRKWWVAWIESGRLQRIPTGQLDEIATLLEAEAKKPRPPRIPQKPRSRSNGQRANGRAPKPPEPPPPAPEYVEAEVVRYRCRPLGARLSAEQCAANRKLARNPRMRRDMYTRMSIEATTEGLAILRGIGPCIRCRGVKAMARHWGPPEVLRARCQTPGSMPKERRANRQIGRERLLAALDARALARLS